MQKNVIVIRIFLAVSLLSFAPRLTSAQRLPSEIIPSGTYTFLWSGVDTNASHPVRSGLLPVTLPWMGHVTRGSIQIQPGTPQRFVLAWTVSALGAPDSAKRLVGVLAPGTIVGPLVSDDAVALLNTDPPSATPGVVHRTKGMYYLLPGMSIRIALSRPTP